MVLLENMETVHSIKTAAQKIIGVLAQPVVTSERRQCIGAEALVRWKHKTKGFVPPEKFVPIAGESDLIHTTRGVGIVYGMCPDESVD